ncbi:MAG TPA: hypothetical protein VHW69_18240 [Rhizomicrobium sp.]|nr:hypothetical protein [Rhizomicrobium sp.]
MPGEALKTWKCRKSEYDLARAAAGGEQHLVIFGCSSGKSSLLKALATRRYGVSISPLRRLCTFTPDFPAS